MNSVRTERSLLLVHAHPDDESIFTGATMAKYAAERAQVTLVTCTMGELGVNPRTRSVAASGSQLAKVRARELETACATLGVTDHRFLGSPGEWRDSGPAGAPSNVDPRSFCAADMDKAANDLIEVIREVRPQVIVTYDANGFYGHPDHIQAHRVAWHAYQLACNPLLTKFYATTMPRSILAGAMMPLAGPAAQKRSRLEGALRLGAADEEVTTEINATAYLNVKMAALKAHTTQISVAGPFFKAAGLMGMRALGTEYYALLAGPSGAVPGTYDQLREDDLFTGV